MEITKLIHLLEQHLAGGVETVQICGWFDPKTGNPVLCQPIITRCDNNVVLSCESLEIVNEEV